MGKVSTVYDALTAVISGQLTSHTQLPNPYEVDKNTYLHLNKGFGVAVGPGADTERYVGCLITWQQAYSVILVRRIITTQNNLTVRQSIEKDVLEDWDLVRKACYNNNTLGGEVIKTTVTDHGGINFIDADTLKFLALEMQVVVEYQEDPTT